MTASPPSAPRLISLPIFWQVLGLALFVLILALGINTLIVLKAPEPPFSGYSIAEAAQALKIGEAPLQNGRKLRARTETKAPAFVTEGVNKKPQPTPWRPFWQLTPVIRQKLSAELHVPVDDLTVYIERRRFEEHRLLPSPPPGGAMPFIAGPGSAPDQQGPPPLDAAPPMSSQSIASPAGTQPADGPPMAPPGPQEDHGPRHVSRLNTAGGEDIQYPPFSAAWKLRDGRYRVIEPPTSLIAPWQGRLLSGFGLTALIILPLVWWMSRNLSRPIIAFSEAAEKLSVEDNAPPVMALGPREVRAAAEVLNQMQARIRKQVESRTALMGAIAHDLKTPLARMRLRIEDLPAPMRDKLNGDIAHMDGLIRSAMSFTSAHKMGETIRPLDLSSLIEALDEDLAVTCEMEPARIEHGVMVKGDQVALKRIVTNLVENACRYATGCRIELSSRGSIAELRIIDSGPGLPPEALENVFEPFFRLESSRNRDTGGTGLGLSVARALVEAQGGKLTLSNRYAGTEVIGLEALLCLPLLTR